MFSNANLWIMSVVPAETCGKYIGLLTTFIFWGLFFSSLFIQPIQNLLGMGQLFGVSAGLLFGLSMAYVFPSGIFRRLRSTGPSLITWWYSLIACVSKLKPDWCEVKISNLSTCAFS